MTLRITLTAMAAVATLFIMSLNAYAANGIQSVDPAEFKHEIETASPDSLVILDVRTPQEYAEGHLNNAVNLNWLDPEAFAAGASQLDSSKHYYVYCRSGRRSLEACEYLNKRGFNVTDLSGGILAWQSAHLPLSPALKVK